MTKVTTAPGSCLNCGESLTGKFCSHCGQRDVPPYPTVHEFVGDAWHEMSGWDGRFVTTIWILLTAPGRLTQEVLEGKRKRYISATRLYLAASLVYFLVSAAAPNVNITTDTGESRPFRVGVWTTDSSGLQLSAEDRAALDRDLAAMHPWLRWVVEKVIADPEGVDRRMFAAMPKVMFVLVPAFALIVSLFYRGRRYTQHLTFALHLHAAAFMALTLAKAATFQPFVPVMLVVGLAMTLGIAVYALRAARRVYGGGWPVTLLKGAAIAVVYALASIPPMIAAVLWAIVAS